MRGTRRYYAQAATPDRYELRRPSGKTRVGLDEVVMNLCPFLVCAPPSLPALQHRPGVPLVLRGSIKLRPLPTRGDGHPAREKNGTFETALTRLCKRPHTSLGGDAGGGVFKQPADGSAAVPRRAQGLRLAIIADFGKRVRRSPPAVGRRDRRRYNRAGPRGTFHNFLGDHHLLDALQGSAGRTWLSSRMLSMMDRNPARPRSLRSNRLAGDGAEAPPRPG